MARRKATLLQIHLPYFIRLANTNYEFWTELGIVNDREAIRDSRHRKDRILHKVAVCQPQLRLRFGTALTSVAGFN